MTLLEELPRGSIRERSIPVLETKRLTLRAPTLKDAKAVAVLANDRRIAENTARIPHPYKLADAESFIAGANKADGETVFLIVRNGVPNQQLSARHGDHRHSHGERGRKQPKRRHLQDPGKRDQHQEQAKPGLDE